MYSALLVEDSAIIRDTLIPTLSELAGIEVLDYAETEADGLALLGARGREAQLLILDIFLRQGTGLGVLEKRAGIHPECTVVLSNHATADMRRRCKKLGASAVFDKSTELDQFFEFCQALPRCCG